MLTIKKTTVQKEKVNVFIIDKYSTLSGKDFSEQEIDFINENLEKDKEIISLSGFNNLKEVLVVSDATITEEGFEKVRKAAAKIFKKNNGKKIKKLIIKNITDISVLHFPFIEGFVLAAYRFDKYFTKKQEEFSEIEQILLIDKKVV